MEEELPTSSVKRATVQEFSAQQIFEIKIYKDNLEKHKKTIDDLRKENRTLKKIIETVCEILGMED